MLKFDSYMLNNFSRLKAEGEDTSKSNLKVRPHWEDGVPAHTTYITHVFQEYDISKGEFPFSNLRPVAVKSGIKEILWIYQDQSNDLDLLKNKYNVTWWDSWDVGDRTIGHRYGHTVKKYDLMNKLLNGIKNDPLGRRHIISLWQEDEFTTPGLNPCAFQTLWSVRGEYLDCTLMQRSSDICAALAINELQYVALLMMVAKATGYKPGKFAHYIENYHIYDRHHWVMTELTNRSMEILHNENLVTLNPKLVLDTDKTDFYSFTIDDFKVVDYNPLPKLNKRIEIAI